MQTLTKTMTISATAPGCREIVMARALVGLEGFLMFSGEATATKNPLQFPMTLLEARATAQLIF